METNKRDSNDASGLRGCVEKEPNANRPHRTEQARHHFTTSLTPKPNNYPAGAVMSSPAQ
jgi:hypothetical protein